MKKVKLNIKKIKFINKYFLSHKRFLNVMNVVFGVNKHISLQILRMGGLSLNTKLGEVPFSFSKYVTDFFINYILVERGLKRYRNALIEDQKNIGSIRGIRLLSGLPINGQRTHTNAKTVRRLFKFYKFEE